MIEEQLFEKYLLSVYRFLNFRLRSEKEIRDNLKKKNARDDIIEKIVIRLKEQKFLNDENFARLWVDSRSRVKPRSQFLLKMELKQKGISDEIIEKVLQRVENEGQSDDVQARALVEKNIKKYSGMQKQELYQKLGGVLARKGFNWNVTKKAIDDVLNEEYNAR